MVVGLIGFAGAVYKWLALSQTPDTATMGVCALAASGGYFASSLLSALKPGPQPPEPPARPELPAPHPDP